MMNEIKKGAKDVADKAKAENGFSLPLGGLVAASVLGAGAIAAMSMMKKEKPDAPKVTTI